MAALKDIGHPLLIFLAVVILAIASFLKVYWSRLPPVTRNTAAAAVLGFTLIGVGVFAAGLGTKATSPAGETKATSPAGEVVQQFSANPTFINNPTISPTFVLPEPRYPTPASSDASQPPQAAQALAPTQPPTKQPASPSRPRKPQAVAAAPTSVPPHAESASTTINVTGTNPTFINGTGTVIHNHGTPNPTGTQ